MRRYFPIATSVFAILFMFTVVASAQNQSTISGFVFGPDRRPVSQVVVELRNEFNMAIRRTRTEGSGRYFFSGLGQGRFIIRVMPLGLGLAEQSEEVEIAGIGVRGRQLQENAQKDIYLRPAKDGSREKELTGVVFAQEVPEEAQRLYRSGSEDIDRQQVDAGIKSLEAALGVAPNYFLALLKLGYVRISQANYALAEPLFERALAVNAESFECLYGLGLSQYSLKKIGSAIATLEKAVVKSPTSAQSHLLLGIARRQDRQYDAAEKAFKLAVKNGDESTVPDAYWNLALLYAHNMNRYADAAKQLELYLKAAPDVPNKETIKKLIKEFREKATT